jgi:bifunctional pyridoxal-dependent enzyme with beta-cystathionase and maltose regulon repressor activities
VILFYENETDLREFCTKHSILISLDQIWKDLQTDGQRQDFVDRAVAWKAAQAAPATETTSKPVELPQVAVELPQAVVELPVERPLAFTEEEALQNPKGARKRLQRCSLG